ncbi:MAG: hypothetical protein EB141_20555, partial [Verrucomicrobia bacterium]|nr:hypothetical protein [Verrucomicrobiota bacterium]
EMRCRVAADDAGGALVQGKTFEQWEAEVQAIENLPANISQLMHLKDLKKGVKTGELTGKTDVANDVTLGTGQMNWPAILKAAQESGVKYYFIEDESPSVVEQVPQTLKFLSQVKF